MFLLVRFVFYISQFGIYWDLSSSIEPLLKRFNEPKSFTQDEYWTQEGSEAEGSLEHMSKSFSLRGLLTLVHIAFCQGTAMEHNCYDF